MIDLLLLFTCMMAAFQSLMGRIRGRSSIREETYIKKHNEIINTRRL